MKVIDISIYLSVSRTFLTQDKNTRQFDTLTFFYNVKKTKTKIIEKHYINTPYL